MTGTVSIIMVSYHTGPVLFASVKAALKQKNLAQLILVNNGNAPDVLARLQQMALTAPRLIVVSGQGNCGFAKAANIGAEKATGEYVLFLHPDCLLPPDAVLHTLSEFQKNPDATMIGAWLQNPDGSEREGGRKRLPSLLGLLWARELKPASETHEVPAISSSFMAMPLNDFVTLHGFDETFFLCGEDSDLCARARAMGGKVFCVPTIKVVRMMSSKEGLSARSLEWQRTKGMMRYFSKHFRPSFLQPLAKLLLLLRFGMIALKTGLTTKHQTVAAKKLMVLASSIAELSETKEFHAKTVLVTGATSQVGLCVIRRLLASGAAVLAISRAPAIPFAHENLRWIQGDLTDQKLHLEGYLVDIAMHCAPLWHLPATIPILADAETKRIIALGSTSVFAKALSHNRFEKDIVEKLTRAERELATSCAEKNIRWTLLRPTLTYGIGLDLNITSAFKFIRRFKFYPVYPPAFGKRQPVHADDVAAAMLASALSVISINKAYNISGGEILTYRQMLEKLFALARQKLLIMETTILPFILDVTGALLQKKHINGEIARRMNDDLIFFHDDATRDFSFHPRGFLTGGLKDIEGF